MFVSSNLGTIQCITFSEYKEHITKCIKHNPGNEIWCSHHKGPEDYPCLSILVKGEDAVINYFSDNNTEMFTSLGDILNNNIVKFENGQYEVAAYQVISLPSALECSLQFFHSQERPLCIKWEEL